MRDETAVSMGLPGRRLIHRTFPNMAIYAGLDTLLVDVRDQALLSSIDASKILVHQNLYCAEYLKTYREKNFGLAQIAEYGGYHFSTRPEKEDDNEKDDRFSIFCSPFRNNHSAGSARMGEG
jgi:hypothetical protein